ncbi:hypothetical protein ACNVED_02465 [Legionella sp. D16C41]|uniref:hypothetical protein n=1 Tax=Legionella sp. D16C41 TaxID=3402688 RepID=UPI003AF97737
MLEQTTSPSAPAPWQLRGQGYICLLKASSIHANFKSSIPEELSNCKKSNAYSLMILVDYTESPVGPYYELLFIPGYFDLNGQQYLSITRIFVSSMDSVINGQQNWGIPKELAEFEVHYDKLGLDRVIVSKQGKVFADLTFRSWPLPMPFTTSFVPKTWRTFIQYDKTHIFNFRPEAYGWVRPARLIKACINPDEFPAVKPEHIIATIKITHFKMTFPKANIEVKNQ